MGINNDDDGNRENVSTSTMFLHPHEHTINNDDNRNGGDVLTSTCHDGD